MKIETLPVWRLTLNQYQRDNLLWLLNACGYPCQPNGEASGVPPFTLANTGDWLGDLVLQLEPGGEPHPNVSTEELQASVGEFVGAAHERGYMQGHRRACLAQLAAAIGGLLGHGAPVPDGAQLLLERGETIATLRRLCEDTGDNDWSDSLSLSDIIEKHLLR